jgi:hypothetical protein
VEELGDDDSGLDSQIPEYDDVTTAPTGDATVDLSSFVRVANWVAGSGPSGYDLCLADRDAGGAFQGPLVAERWAAIDAGSAAGGEAAEDSGNVAATTLPFPSVTSYLTVAPGDYVVRLVAFGMGCAVGISPDFTEVPPLYSHAYSTLVILGTAPGDGGEPDLRIEEFEDDQTVAGYAAVRFVQAVPGVSAIDFGLVAPSLGEGEAGGGFFSALATDVAYGSISRTPGGDAGAIDDNGYLLTAPWMGKVLAARTTAGAATVAQGEDSVDDSAAVTVALVGASATHAQLLQCTDTAYPGPRLSECSLLALPVPDAGTANDASTDAGAAGDGSSPDADATGGRG